MRIPARRVFLVTTSALAVMAACREYGADEDTNAPPRDGGSGEGGPIVDAPSGDGNAGDVGSGPCRLDQPFGKPSLVPGLESPDEDTMAHLSDNENTVTFSSRRADAASPVFYFASRPTRFTSFGAIAPMLGYTEGDLDPMLSGDGLRLFFASDTRGGAGSFDLFVTTREKPTDGFFNVVENLGSANTEDPDFHPFARAGGVWFTSLRDSTNRAIYFAPANGASFGPALKVGELESDFNDENPTPSGDGLSIYFSSDRSNGNSDIWFAERKTTKDPFGAPRPVAELNGPSFEQPTWLSLDGCRLYFQSDRAASMDLYVAEKPAN
jgi:hypothetical protein